MGIKSLVRRISQELLPFDMGFLTDKFLKKAEEELHETREIRDKCLAELRELLKKETNLVCRTDEKFLLQFLRARKFNVNKAFSLVKKFYSFKKKNEDIFCFSNESYQVIEKAISEEVVGFLPYRDKDGCAIFVVKIGKWNPSEVSVEDVIRVITVMLYCSIEDPVTQVNGYKVIMDFKGQNFKHLRYCTPYYVYFLYYATQECFPGRFKGIHIMNQSFVYKAGYSLMQPFLSEKLKKRGCLKPDHVRYGIYLKAIQALFLTWLDQIGQKPDAVNVENSDKIHLHGSNTDSLHHYLPPSLLPTEYNGWVKGYDYKWMKKAASPETLKDHLKYGYK